MTLTEFLQDRLLQLEDRKMIIPRYIKRKAAFIGKKDFSLNDLPKIQMQIDETKAAIKAIDDFHKNKKKKKTIPLNKKK